MCVYLIPAKDEGIPMLLQQVAVDVEGCFCVVGTYVGSEPNFAHIGQQRAVDFAATAFLVVAHECDDGVVVLASYRESAVIVAHVMCHGVKYVAWELVYKMRQDEFHY